MIDHVLIVETRPGSGEVLPVALADWDFSRKPGILSLAKQEFRSPRPDCHSVFLHACQQLEDFIAERKVRPAVSRVIAVVDSADWMQLDPLQTVGDYDREKRSPLLALLILTFPEVLWVFAHLRGADSAPTFVQRSHLLDQWFKQADGKPCKAPAIEPLMDVTGLRNNVRERASNQSEGKRVTLQFRQEWAVAMDDESAYAYFNAYTQYRHGFRAAPVCSWAAADYLLGKEAPDSSIPMVSFEDLYMSFPDVPGSGKVSLSNLSERDATFPLLSKATYRTILTSGHRNHASRSVDREIKRRHAQKLFKPIGGMFSMWKSSGLWRKLRSKDKQRKSWIGGYVPGYHPGVPVEPSDEGASHSAPGALLTMAEVLIARAERVKRDMVTVEDVVLGAVLATEAFELLASRTPTLSLDALSLKHELETKAECCFNGVQNHFDVRSRLRKIRKGVEMLSKWYDPWNQDVACWNAEAAVLRGIKTVFQEHEQFDEEMLYADRSRTLHRRLWFRERLGKVVGTWLRFVNPFYWVAWYVGFLLKGIPAFVLMFTIWLGVLTCGFHEVENEVEKSMTRKPVPAAGTNGAPVEREQNVAWAGPWPRALADAFSCMVSVGPPLHTKALEASGDKVKLAYLLSCLGMAGGFLHLGIFISHLYSVVARKK